MNYFFNFKTLVFTMVMALSALSLNAQWNDNFFQIENDDAFYLDRGVGIAIGAGGITNQGVGEPAPLGSGLAVLAVAAAGYAAIKRKRRNNTALILAIALVLGMTSCRKNLDTINNVAPDKVHITLNVGSDSRANVDPTGGGTFATVQYENGDIIYVGYNNHYVGYMTYGSGGFSGDVDLPTSTTDPGYVPDTQLDFYYLGGKGYTANQTGNTFTVDISDQGVIDVPGGARRYPIISYAKSIECYDPDGLQQYSARLLNKCAMVKFNVNKPDGYNQAGTCIVGLNNLVTVDFTKPDEVGNGFSYSQVNDGAITIDSKIGEVWAVLLPQEDITAGGDMTVFSGRRKGTRPALGTIAENDYKPEGVDLDVMTEFVPEGALNNAVFKVGDDKYVIFSKSILQATTTDGWNTWSWRFKDDQYTYTESKDENVGNNYASKTVVSHFGWATSGFNLRGIEDQDQYCYKPNVTYARNGQIYGPDSYDIIDITGPYAKGDWGYNKITNNAYKQWRCMSKTEWDYLKVNHDIRWAKITVGSNKYYGIVLFPYGVSATIEQEASLSVSQWNDLENAGAVFMPVNGHRGSTSGSNYNNTINAASMGTYGYYWTSTCSGSNTAYEVYSRWFEYNMFGPEANTASYGDMVRLVCE